jgi:hypothetical protein
MAAIRSAPVAPIAPISLGKAERPKPVHGSDGENAGTQTPVRSAPPPGVGILVDKTV